MRGFVKLILLKRGLRSDAIWTRTPFFSWLARIPLALDTAALMRSQYWPRATIDAYQRERLRSLFRDARRVPFWRDAFDRAGIEEEEDIFAALRKIRVVSREAFSPLDESYHIERTWRGRSDADHTSGSTARPFHFYFDHGSSLRSYGVTERIFRTAGRGHRYPIAYLRSRPRNGFTFLDHIWVRSLGYRDVEQKIDELCSIARSNPQGFILYAYTSSLIRLAQECARRSVTLPLKAAMAAGENLTEAQRISIERHLRTELYTLYASREAGFLGYECEHHRLHLAEDWAHVEIVDERGRGVAPGVEGRVIVTTFDNRVMPFIRYEIGDRATVSPDPCPCGRTFRTITLRGRIAEIIDLSEGRTAALLDVSAMIDRYADEIRHYQLVQRSSRTFLLRIVPGPSYETGKDKVVRGLRSVLGDVDIVWEIVDEIPPSASGKATYFVRE